MPIFFKSKFAFILLIVPSLTALAVALLALLITGASPMHIFQIIGSSVVVASVFSLISLISYRKFLKNRTKEMVSLLDKRLIPDQSLKNLAYQSDEVTASAQFINNLAKNFNTSNTTSGQLSEILQAEQERTMWILQNMTDPVIGLDLRLNVSFANPAAEKVLGLDLSLSKGQPLDQLLKFQTQLGELPLKDIIPLKQSGFEGILFSKNEVKVLSLLNDKEASANIMTIQIRHGASINLACFISFHDITAEKQLEAMKLDFISMAAHELRTPLTSIKGYISVFIQENEKKMTEDQMMFIRRINNSAQQLSALIENLLGVSRVERGAMTVTTQPMDWLQVLQQAYEQFEHRAIEKRIELQFIKPKDPLPTVQADNVRINEVINNFLANAINYTEPGGKVIMWTEFKDHYIYTHVKDSGRGLPKEALNRLFTKFYRVPGNLDQASKGNGLGLYISKAIVELHHGKIWANSEGLGKGSTFSFSLPVVETKGLDLSILTKKL